MNLLGEQGLCYSAMRMAVANRKAFGRESHALCGDPPEAQDVQTRPHYRNRMHTGKLSFVGDVLARRGPVALGQQRSESIKCVEDFCA